MRTFVSNNVTAILLVLGAVVFGSAYFYQVSEEKKRAECQASYNEAFATQLMERSRLSAASDDAKNELLKGVSKLVFAPPAITPRVQAERSKKFRDLFAEFDKAVEMVEQDRAATPLPEIPNC